MKVSIIIPIYKVEPWLRPCLDSVLAQTFRDYECILVDDGSPDGCPAICDEYAGRDPRFRVIHKENGGLSDARNAGLDAAAGEYLYFLDSDDTVEPELLATMVPLMEEGYDLVTFGYRRLMPDGSVQNVREYLDETFLLSGEEERMRFFLDVLLPGKIGWEAPTRLFRSESIRRYGLRFADNRRIFAEDLYFSMCYCAHAERIRALALCPYNYRIRENSIMDVQSQKSNLGRLGELGNAVLTFYRRFDDCQVLVENFSALYYTLMAEQFLFQLWNSGRKPEEFRDLVRQEVQDWDFMENKLREGMARAKKWNRFRLDKAELRDHVEFLLGGSCTRFRLRCRAVRELRKKGGK